MDEKYLFLIVNVWRLLSLNMEDFQGILTEIKFGTFMG